MFGIFGDFIAAVFSLFSWPLFGFVLLGTLIGLTFGAIPGLGGPVAIALLIPATFGMDTTTALVLFGSTLGGVAFGGSASAILVNIPGTAPNAATCLDGYPMTKNGRAGEALGVSATASAVGAVFGIVVLLVILPFSRELLLLFRPANYFWIAIIGLVTVASVSQGNFVKGVVSGGLGLLISFIGFSNLHGTYRYGFDTQYLYDGVQLLPIVIGTFAIAEAIRLFSSPDQSIVDETSYSFSDIFTGVRYVLTNPIQVFRSSVIGVLIGVIPAAGGAMANFVAYMQAKEGSNDPGSFGQGNPAGVLASEASNDAKDGGSLLPTVLFGIPGSATMAVLLGAFLIHGITPGRSIITEDLPLLLSLVAALLLANLLTSLIGLSVANQLVKLTKMDSTLLVPPILAVSLVGAFAARNNLGDVFVAVLFGILGFALIAHNFSRIPLILGVILGPLTEQYFFQALQFSDQGAFIFVSDWISIVLILLLVIVGTLIARQRGGQALTSLQEEV
jgi:putative tricarboxylic transport membrane protein